MKSMELCGTYATTVLVPRTNMPQMMGEAIHTDWPMVRAGCRLSPARMAMYSKPQSPPNMIWPNSANVRRSLGGAANDSGDQWMG